SGRARCGRAGRGAGRGGIGGRAGSGGGVAAASRVGASGACAAAADHGGLLAGLCAIRGSLAGDRRLPAGDGAAFRTAQCPAAGVGGGTMTRYAGMARRWLRRAAALAMLLAVSGGGAAVASAQETGAVPAPTTVAFAQDEAAISVLPPPAA